MNTVVVHFEGPDPYNTVSDLNALIGNAVPGDKTEIVENILSVTGYCVQVGYRQEEVHHLIAVVQTRPAVFATVGANKEPAGQFIHDPKLSL